MNVILNSETNNVVIRRVYTQQIFNDIKSNKTMNYLRSITYV